jgi:NADP-dependent 3-hydroxy acid dehydrogenase YdfG
MTRFEPSPARRPAIVAGASSGIGAATACELASRGFPVALGARRIDKLSALVEQIRDDGGESVAFPLDITDDGSVKSFVGQAIDALGAIELVVSGAGDMTPGLLHEISTNDFLEQIQIHLIGANRLVTAVLPAMVSRRRGDVMFIGSDTALWQRPHMGAYGAAKAALVAMVKNLQIELEGTGVRASIIHPGPTSTNMGVGLPADKLDAMLADWVTWGHGRHSHTLRACDVARTVAFVAETPRGVNITHIEIQPEAPLVTPPVQPGQPRVGAAAPASSK